MRVYYLLIVIFVLFYSCYKQKKETNKNIVVYDTTVIDRQVENQKKIVYADLDSLKDKIIEAKVLSDTIKYQFSLEDVGTEGNEGTAYYSNNRLQKVKVNIYTSMWETSLLYVFNNGNIIVTERIYNFHEKKKLVKNFSYKVDFNGIPLETVQSDRTDIFQELKKAIPFNLTKATQ